MNLRRTLNDRRGALAPALTLALTLAAAGPALAAPVLMITVDGLRPLDVIDAPERGFEAPNLRRMMQTGAYAEGVRNVLPTVTYPDHTTLVTGVWPDRHGIASNLTFDPLRKNLGGWYWYAVDEKAPTLWGAVKAAGGVTASLGWPVTVGQGAIDDNIPEYWRAYTDEDAKLEHALATPGLPEAIAKESGVTLVDIKGLTPEDDEAKARAAAAIYRIAHPMFFTLHLSALDEDEHIHGPGSPQAKATLKRVDAAIGELVRQARAVEPDLVVIVASDHGFAPVRHDIDLDAELVRAGLMTLGPDGQPVDWKAAAWISGGSAQIMLKDPDDAAVRAKVQALLARLAADPNSGIGEVAGPAEIARMGGAPGAAFWVDARIGYTFGDKLTGPLVAPPSEKGTHGFFPSHPEMRAALFIDGPGVPAGRALGEVDMRDIAPTAARLMDVAFPSAEGKPLF